MLRSRYFTKAVMLFLNESRYKGDLHRFRFRNPAKEGTSQKYNKVNRSRKVQYSKDEQEVSRSCVMVEG